MKKKAQFNIGEILIYLFFITASAIFIVIVIGDYKNQGIKTIDLETFLLAKKLTYSDTCLAYNDDVRVHQGTVDLEKVRSDRLAKCFTKPGFGYSIEILTFDSKTIKTASNLDIRQEAALPICKRAHGYSCTNRTDIILYYDQGEYKTGYFVTEVIKFV